MNGLPRERHLPADPDPDPWPIGRDGGSGAVATGRSGKVVQLFHDAAGSLDALSHHGDSTDEPLILRRRLFDRLAKARRVTIVSAPAGSGKTMLLDSWIAEAGFGGRAAWASVQREEHDGQRFWASVIDALAGVAVGDGAASRIRDADGPRSDALLERLMETLQRLREPALLVIDDLHELQSADALESLERFLTELPARLRVVLLTRANARLRLHRLRLAGALTELRAADMRFSPSETHALLTASGIELSDADSAGLHGRTEGWAAGLRLATIALAGHPDPERFAVEFCGSERTVAAFLQAEVLDHQPPEVRDLLLRTSVLESVNAPLADALTGRSGSLRILQALDEANAFVTAIDVGRSSFRYHPMLADLLCLELRRANPALVRTLHRTAARWFELHGPPVEAIRHAQSAGDWGYAARLLADHQLALTLDGGVAEIRELAAAFPPDAREADAELGLAVAAAHLADGQYEEAGAHLAMAESLAATVHVDRRRAFELALAATKLRLACARGDLAAVPRASQSVEAALEAQPPTEVGRMQTYRASALVDLGIAELWSLRPVEARRHLEQALECSRRIEQPSLEITSMSFLALVATLTGRPASVGRPLVEQAASLADEHGSQTQDGAAAALAVGASTLVWLGRCADAERCLERAERALARGGAPWMQVLVKHTWALLRLGQNRIDDALTALRDADRLQLRLVSAHPFSLDLRSRALRAQVHRGETPAVRAAITGMTPDSRGSAEIRIAAAALELSEGSADEAIEEVRPVIEGSAQALHRASAVIEALLYDAAARREMGDTRAAEASIERALELAEPEGLLLPFALAPVRELLERQRGHRTAHATLLLTILDLLAGSSPQPEAPPLADPLSGAEVRVVRYLPTNLKGPEIAAELCVSANTIRTHLRHIYAKFDVHRRSEAVARARQLGLLAPA